jgi:hypothetical protein
VVHVLTKFLAEVHQGCLGLCPVNLLRFYVQKRFYVPLVDRNDAIQIGGSLGRKRKVRWIHGNARTRELDEVKFDSWYNGKLTL